MMHCVCFRLDTVCVRNKWGMHLLHFRIVSDGLRDDRRVKLPGLSCWSVPNWVRAERLYALRFWNVSEWVWCDLEQLQPVRRRHVSDWVRCDLPDAWFGRLDTKQGAQHK